MKLYRVFPYDPNAAPTEKGGVLFRSGSPYGRIANPDLYRELYLGGTAGAAIAEILGRLPSWSEKDFEHASGRRLHLASFTLAGDARIFDIDDARALVRLGIKPSQIVIRNRAVTQAWARKIYMLRTSIGIAWWCYYEPSWPVYGLWDVDGLVPDPDPQPLHADHPAVVEAAKVVRRQIV